MSRKLTCDPDILCKNIKKLHESSGLSKTAMARRLGITVKSLSALESGVIPPRVSYRILLRIHSEFGIHPKDLFLPM